MAWKQTFENFTVQDLAHLDALRFELWSHNRLALDELRGHVTVTLDSVCRNQVLSEGGTATLSLLGGGPQASGPSARGSLFVRMKLWNGRDEV